MAIHLLSPITLDRLKPEPGKTETMHNDGGGLWLRVRPGVKTWLFIYTKPVGGRGKETLGNYPDHSLDAARAWAQSYRQMLDRDIDPGLQRKAANATQRALASKTLGDLLDGYVAHLTRLGKSSAKQVERSLKPVGEALRKLPASAVTTADLMTPIRKLTTAGKKRAAGILRSNLGAAFNLAINAEKDASVAEDMLGYGITTNPVAEILPIRGGQGYDSPGDRMIPIDVLHAYRDKLPTTKANDTRDVLMLHLLTGNRAEQIIGSTIEGNDLVLMDPKGRRATARRHTIPLVGRVAEVIEARKGRPFSVTAAAVGKRLKKLTGGYTIPDMRRTIETNLVRLGFSLDVTGELMSHGTTTGVQKRHYIRHDYRPQKIAAMLAWENCLYQSATENVLPLRSAA